MVARTLEAQLYVFTNGIMDCLLAKDHSKLRNMLEELIERNYALGGPKEGFLMEGQFLTALPPKQQFLAQKSMPHPSLHSEVREYLAECRILDSEAKVIQQGLSLLTSHCKTSQDLRDALPEDIVELSPNLRNMTRYRPEAWCLEGKEFHMHQYTLAKEKMMFYITNQMLY